MAIKGSLKEASLPDVLQLLALGQKTGCLSIADRSNFGVDIVDVENAERAYAIAGKASTAPGPGGKPLGIEIEVRQVMSGPPDSL